MFAFEGSEDDALLQEERADRHEDWSEFQRMTELALDTTLSDEQREAAGAGPDVVRLSVGLEDADDLLADLDRALGVAR